MDLPDVDNTEEFRCISLCTGYAGLELGIRRAVPALRTVCYVEVEAFACANLVSKIEKGELDAAPIWTDIKTFDGRPFRKRVHIITAGYPCQGESHAGKRLGQSDPRWLWTHIERIIETVEPVWFFGENVSGHLSLGFPTVYRSLRNLGYKVEAGLFAAEEVGAPHKRERLFILAHSKTAEWWWLQKEYSGWGLEKTGRPNRSELENASRAASSNQDGQIERRTRQEDVPQGNGKAGSVRLGATSELADTAQFAKREQGNETGSITRENPREGSCRGSFGMWPSRPGHPQYEWEEPRIVDDTRGKKRTRLSSNERQAISETRKTSKGQAQSRLGRAANGTPGRVDRLRLLGNGVVPQQAELAFRTLFFEANR